MISVAHFALMCKTLLFLPIFYEKILAFASQQLRCLFLNTKDSLKDWIIYANWVNGKSLRSGRTKLINKIVLFEIMQISLHWLQSLIMVFLRRKYTLVARKFELHYLFNGERRTGRFSFGGGGGGGSWSLARIFFFHRLYKNEGVCPNIT